MTMMPHFLTTSLSSRLRRGGRWLCPSRVPRPAAPSPSGQRATNIVLPSAQRCDRATRSWSPETTPTCITVSEEAEDGVHGIGKGARAATRWRSQRPQGQRSTGRPKGVKCRGATRWGSRRSRRRGPYRLLPPPLLAVPEPVRRGDRSPSAPGGHGEGKGSS